MEYLLEEAAVGIRRNGLMAFASISTIALSLAVLSTFVLAALGANHFASTKINQFEIAVFVKNANADAVSKILSDIEGMKGVESAVMRPRDKEWADMKREQPNFEAAGLALNPLPFAIDVRISEPSRRAVIANDIRAMGGVDAVRDSKETWQRVMAVAGVLKAMSITGVILLLITTVFVISNAIRLTLYARRREIRIMQLVGATNQFIRLPLVLEGMVFGAAGAVAAWIILKIGATYIAHVVESITPVLGQFSSDVNPARLAGGMLILGAVIGAAGSLVSIRRFLRD